MTDLRAAAVTLAKTGQKVARAPDSAGVATVMCDRCGAGLVVVLEKYLALEPRERGCIRCAGKG